MDVLRERLRNQRLIPPVGRTAAETVRWMGAVQAQDYVGARWAVAQRTAGPSGAAVDDALADGSIVRIHVLRPTWHLVIPADLGWMLALTAPRVKALAAYGNRESGLDDATIARSNRALAKALHGGQLLTRPEMGDVLRRAGIEPRDAIGLGRLMLAAELDGVVCSGGLRGKQHTYALFEERIPAFDVRDRDAALVALAARYLASHGPATIRDFAWWSGLSVTDATTAVRTVGSPVHAPDIRGESYWAVDQAAHAPADPFPVAHLLPNFDEYTVGYTDRSPLIDRVGLPHTHDRPELILGHVVLVDGRLVGTWKRSVSRKLAATVTLLVAVTAPEQAAIAAATERYTAFSNQSTPTS